MSSMNFPSEEVSREEKGSKKWGLRYAQALYASANEQRYSYNFESNSDRYKANIKLAQGLESTDPLKSRMSVNGDTQYLNMDYTVSNPLPRLARTITGRLSEDPIEIEAEAVDVNSLTEIDKKKRELEFKMLALKTGLNEQVEKGTGQPVVGFNEEVPKDKEELELYMNTTFKRSRTIAIEQIIDYFFQLNKLENKKYKLAENFVNLKIGGFKVDMCDKGNISIRHINPVNLVTSRCVEDDFSDAKHMGEIRYIPIHQLRKEAKGDLSEEDLFYIAKSVAGSYDNETWEFGSRDYYSADLGDDSPYDDFSVKVLSFEMKTDDCLKWEKRKSRQNSFKVKQVGFDYEPKRRYKDVTTIKEKTVETIYSGNHIVNTKYIYGWGIRNNQLHQRKNGKIMPQTNFSYIVNMPEMHDMRNKSLIEEAAPFAYQIGLGLLKVQQLVMKAKPPGYIIDVTAVQGVISGMGGKSGLDPISLRSITDQIGDFYYSSIREDGQPITNTRPVDFFDTGVSKDLERILNTIDWNQKQILNILGVQASTDSADPDPKALVGIAKLGLSTHAKSTKNLVNAMRDVIQRTAEQVYMYADMRIRKGVRVEELENAVGKADVEMIKITDIPNREFGIFIKTGYTDDEKEELSLDIQKAVQNGLLPIEDGIELRQTLKSGNVKQAVQELIQKKKSYANQKAQEQQQMAQMEMQKNTQAAQARAQAEMAIQQQKIQAEMQLQQQKYDLEARNEQQKNQYALEQINMKGEWDLKKVEEAEDKDGKSSIEPSPSDFIG